MKLVSLDIETTGLDPRDAHIVAIGFSTSDGKTYTRVSHDDEVGLLLWAEDRVAGFDGDHLLVTWNGEEFDFPFLASRYAARSIVTTLKLVRRPQTGKYGMPLHNAIWGPLEHHDIAPDFRSTAEALGVDWSLKPVARAVLHTEPIEVDRRGHSIERMSPEDVRAYLESDIRVTLALARRVVGSETAGPISEGVG